MIRPWTSGPPCPRCAIPGCSRHPALGVLPPPQVVCVACGHVWEGTVEDRARAEASDAAWDAEEEREARVARERREIEAAKERARELYTAAGRPVPEWAR